MKPPDFLNVDNSFQNFRIGTINKTVSGNHLLGLQIVSYTLKLSFPSPYPTNKDCHGFRLHLAYCFKAGISLDYILFLDKLEDFINYVVTVPSNYVNSLFYSCPDVFINQFPTLWSFALHFYSFRVWHSSVFSIIWNHHMF